MATPVAPPTLASPAAVARGRPAGLRRVSLPLLGLLTVAALLRLVLWDRAYGFEQGDPVEYVNIAYRIAFGIGIEWWDLRPLLLSLIYVPVMLVMQWWPDPTGEAMVRALRLVGVLFSLGSVALTYAIGRQLGQTAVGAAPDGDGTRLGRAAEPRRGRLGGETVGLTAGLLVAVNPVFNRLSVTTFAEVPSTFFVLLAVWLLVRRPELADQPGDTHPTRSDVGSTTSFALSPWERVPPTPAGRGQGEGHLLLGDVALAGLALGLGCMIRYQAIAYLAPFGLWLLTRDLWRVSPARWPATLLDPRSLTLRFGLGLGVAALAQALIETLAYGRPFHSLLVSFQYNVTSGLAPVEFGAEPFEWFLLTIPRWFGSVPVLLALVGLVATIRGPRAAEWRLVGLASAAMFLVLSALPHKEERFMTQVVPLLALFAGAGVATLAGLAGPLGRFIPTRRDWTWGTPRPAPSPSRGEGPTLAPGGRGAEGGGGAKAATLLAAGLVVAAAPLLWTSWTLDVRANAAYVDGARRAAELRPGGTLGTIPWFVPRPYTGTRLALERMDRNVWNDRERVARTIEQSDFLLFPEYWLLEDRAVDRLVEAGFRPIESYENGVALYQSRRLDDPPRRRPRS